MDPNSAEDHELYRPPNAELATGASAAESLYSPGQVAVATFLGSPLAGGWLIAANFHELGLPDARRMSLFAAVVVFLVAFVLALYLPEDFPSVILWLAYTAAARQAAVHWQGGLFSEHIESGGRKHSNWRMLLVTVLAFLVAAIVSFVIVMLLPEALLPQL